MTGPRAMRQGALNAASRELLAARRRVKEDLEIAQRQARAEEASYRQSLAAAEALAVDIDEIETALDAMGVTYA